MINPQQHFIEFNNFVTWEIAKGWAKQLTGKQTGDLQRPAGKHKGLAILVSAANLIFAW